MKEINLTDEKIESIVDELLAGFLVYLNTETYEIKSVPDEDSFELDMSLWKKDLKEIRKNRDKYLVFEKMDSSESFSIMDEFTETVEDTELRQNLQLVLGLAKPFRNFNDVISRDYDYRQKWFQFRNKKYAEYIKDQVEAHNNRMDD